MSVFSSRSAGYKGGVVLLFFATFVFIVGFAVPCWVMISFRDSEGYIYRFQGLLMMCLSYTSVWGTLAHCEAYIWEYIDSAFHAVRTLESLCLIGLLASCVLALVTNCCRTVPGPHNTALEIMASRLSGLLGFVGCMVFVGSIKEGKLNGFVTFEDHIHFSFYFATIGSGLCVVAAIIIAINNTPLDAETQPAAFHTVPMTTFPQGQVQGQGQGQPASGGVFYGQPPGNAQPPGYYPQPIGYYPQLPGYYPQLYENSPQSYGKSPQSDGYPAAK